MRALLSWDIDPKDANFQRILFDLAALLPAGQTQRLTTWTALIDPITATGFRDLGRRLEALTIHYDNRLFLVFSLQPAGAVIVGKFRPLSPVLTADVAPAPDG